MTITELKQYIYKNNKIEYILEQIGCHHIQYHNKGYYTCTNKDGDNKTAINIYNNENLTCINHTRDMGDNISDLITLVCFNMNLSFVDAIKYLHKLLDLKYDYKNRKNKQKENNKIDPLEIFKKIKRKRKKVNISDIEIYDNTIIEEYIPLPHINWIREGILLFTCEVFNIGYSFKKNRIVIPWHYWCGTKNDIVGVMGRSTLSNEQCDMLDIPKYLPLKAFPKSLHIYGLQQNYKIIQEVGYCVLAESEKSTLKRHSRLDGTVVAVGSHNLSEEQVKILIGINVNIIIGYDKDIPLKHIRSECEKFYGIRNVYYIYDKYDLLQEKDAPMDAPDKIYKYLLKHKIKYDEKEHKEYLKEIEDDKKKR